MKNGLGAIHKLYDLMESQENMRKNDNSEGESNFYIFEVTLSMISYPNILFNKGSNRCEIQSYCNSFINFNKCLLCYALS